MVTEVVYDVMNAQVHPGSGGQAMRCVLEIATPPPGPRRPSASFCTLTMLRPDAEHLLAQLQQALHPPESRRDLN